VQQLQAECEVVNEVQVLTSSTTQSIQEEQIVYISTSYANVDTNEQQLVTCDATGGSFRLTFAGYTTSVTIAYDAGAAAIEAALQQIEIISDVTVAFFGTQTTACFERTTATQNDGFLVTFNNIVDMDGNLPLMTASTNSLKGARYIAISETIPGDAGIGGTFRLSFRGSITEDIEATITSSNYATVAADIQTKLEQLDTISTSGVTVTSAQGELATSDFGQLYRITFTGIYIYICMYLTPSFYNIMCI
jgi:hypothetical protein